MIWGFRDILGPKNDTRKVKKIHKGFKLYQVFMHNFLCQNIWIFYIYSLLEELTQFGLMILAKFGLELLRHFGHKKSYKKNLQNFAQRF